MPRFLKSKLNSTLHRIMQAYLNDAFAPLREGSFISKERLEKRIQAAHYHLMLMADVVPFSYEVMPRALEDEWEALAGQLDAEPAEKRQQVFDALLRKTLKFLEYITTLERARQTTDDADNVRMMSSEQMQAELKRLDTMLKGATQKLEEAMKKGDSNNEDIARLKGIISEYQSKIVTLRDKQEAHESDKLSEAEWNQRLTDSFAELDEKSSKLNFEVVLARIEYFVCVGLLIGVSIWFFCWYHDFYGQLTAEQSPIHITSWISYLPYALPVTAYIALMWILMVQKNRASKLSIMLSTRLANVHYLEGLMKLVNRLSSNTDTAVTRINVVVEKMIDSYLRQLEAPELTEKRIDKIEEKEQREVPQNRLKDELMKLLKHE